MILEDYMVDRIRASIHILGQDDITYLNQYREDLLEREDLATFQRVYLVTLVQSQIDYLS